MAAEKDKMKVKLLVVQTVSLLAHSSEKLMVKSMAVQMVSYWDNATEKKLDFWRVCHTAVVKVVLLAGG